jgi:hypothetical protein
MPNFIQSYTIQITKQGVLQALYASFSTETGTAQLEVHRLPEVDILENSNSLRHRVQTGSGTHSPCYPMSTGNSFPGSQPAWEFS